ncbi:MAG: four helix bundle protein [Bacteroidia bacterium]
MEEGKNNFREQMVERLLEFAARIIKLDSKLCSTYTGKHIYGQLFRSGSSAGANYEESIGAESKADFIHKSQVVLKELRETYYWLRLILKSQLLSINDEDLKVLIPENLELIKIISKSLVTAKQNRTT